MLHRIFIKIDFSDGHLEGFINPMIAKNYLNSSRISRLAIKPSRISKIASVFKPHAKSSKVTESDFIIQA